MLLALGAVSSALDALQSLTEIEIVVFACHRLQQDPTNPFDFAGSSAPSGSSAPASGAGGFSQISPATMSALLAAQSQSSTGATTSAPTSRSDALKDLFSQLDADGDGQRQQIGIRKRPRRRWHQHRAGRRRVRQTGQERRRFGQPRRNDVGAEGIRRQGVTIINSRWSRGSATDRVPIRCCKRCRVHPARSVTNSDGSTTTSMTYADGSKVTMTSPAATTSSGAATSSYNIIEQMIQREAQAISSGATASLSLNV